MEFLSWRFYLDAKNQTKQLALAEYGSNSPTHEITISPEYLEPTKYNFTVVFNNEGLEQNATYIMEESLNMISEVKSIAATIDTAKQENVTLNIIRCFDGPMTIIWTNTAGSLDFERYLSPDNMTLILPPCVLSPSSEYNFIVRVSFTEYPETFKEGNVTIYTLPEEINVSLKPDRTYPEGIDVNIYGSYQTKCPNTSAVIFSWTCGTNNNICDEDGNIYGSSSESISFDIPKEYLVSGSYEINFTALYQGLSSSIIGIINISDAVNIEFDLLCVDCPEKYNQHKDMTITAAYSLPSDDLSFAWEVFPSILLFENTTNLINILSNTLQLSTYQFIMVSLYLQNATHIGEAYFQIPINHPPKNGRFEISPSTGNSITTRFTLSCPDWEDEDLPLSYQFFYMDNNSPIGPSQADPFLETIFSARRPQELIHQYAVITDSLGATIKVNSDVLVVVAEESLTEMMNTVSNLLNQIISSGNTTQINDLLTLADALEEFEDVQGGCPSCSGHGTCIENECHCHSQYTLPDCSLSVSDFEELIDLKKDILNLLNDTLTNTNNTNQTDLRGKALDTIEKLSNPTFNTNETLSIIKDIFDNTLNLSSNDTILTPEESETVATILDNIIKYVSTSDCKAETNLTKDIQDSLADYLETVSRSLLANQTTNGEASIITRDNFEMYLSRMTLCQILQSTINTSPGTPAVNLEFNDPQDCENKVYDIQYYLFVDDLFNCYKAGDNKDSKNTISLKITDPETKEDVSSDFSMNVKMPPGKSCPSGCSTESSGSCKCNDLSLFNPKAQIMNIFKESQLSNLANIQALANWKFYESFAFWTVLTMVVAYVVSVVLVVYCIPKYCLIKKLKRKSRITGRQSFSITLLVSNNLSLSHFRFHIHF